MMQVAPALVKASPCDYCHAPERLCPFCKFGGRPVSVGFGPGISVADVAVITGQIQKVEIMWNGQSVTKVPVGQNFNIRATIVANNPGGGFWQIGLTVIEIPATGQATGQGEVANLGTFANSTIGKNNGISTGIGSGYFDITDLGSFVMPNTDLRLRVKLWVYPFQDTSVLPDRSAW